MDLMLLGFAPQAAADSSTSLIGLLRDIETAKLLFILIFGTGFVSAAGYAISAVIRAFNASPEDSDELASRVANLEARLSQLETQQPK